MLKPTTTYIYHDFGGSTFVYNSGTFFSVYMILHR